MSCVCMCHAMQCNLPCGSCCESKNPAAYSTSGIQKAQDNEILLRSEVRSQLRSGLRLEDALKVWSKLFIEESLSDNDGNQVKAAQQLGLHRNTLSRAIDRLGIDLKQFLAPRKPRASQRWKRKNH